ncbi:MAG: 2-oxo acid dehydrogenase subunit E2 [Sphingobacteriaceae bacterium]|nr:MAG: pyruvate dehydrogenase [Pedobacter sp.]
MAEVIRMPKMSDTMTEGLIAKWHKKVGDQIKSGDLIAEIETDKATMDFESFQEGTLLYIGSQEGQTAPVDSVIAIIGELGEDYRALLSEGSTPPALGDEEVSVETKLASKVESKPVSTSMDKSTSTSSLAIDANVIRMPLLSDTMTEGVIAEWHKKVGDKVKSDDVLADVETDKATMDVVGYVDGTLLYIGVEKGQAAKVNDIIAIVGKDGTDISSLLMNTSNAKASAEQPVADDVKKAESTVVATVSTLVKEEDSTRIKASPLARKMARDKGINLNEVKGSAAGGRIVKKDVEEYQPLTVNLGVKTAMGDITIPPFVGEEKFIEKPVSQMRKVIAKRLSDSLFTSPHFYLTMSIDMGAAMVDRVKMNEFSKVKISFNDMIVKAVAIALKQHPNVNSSWLGDKIRYNEHVNIGVAVAVEDGLLVPVVRFADGKSLSHISAEVRSYSERAKAKKLQPADWEGSTFTISNLGMFGIEEFTAIINPPDACILAVGGIQEVPVVKNGALVPGHVMKVTLSCDHRVVDGATGAAFLQTLKLLLEEPVRLLV